MAAAGFVRLFLASVFLSCFIGICCVEGVNLADLNTTLIVTASPSNGSYLKAGMDKISVTWGLNPSETGKDSEWKSVIVKLCYAPISQKDRAWRMTKDPLKKDKTCQFTVVSMDYISNGKNTSFTSVVKKDVPTAYYFIRAYAFNAAGTEVAYGQTTNMNKTDNIFFVEAVTGRHLSLDIASVTFSAFSVVSLFGFFYLEKRKAKSPPSN